MNEQDKLSEYAARAINDFLFLLSQGYSPRVAFERAVDGVVEVALVVPSNLRIEVAP